MKTFFPIISFLALWLSVPFANASDLTREFKIDQLPTLTLRNIAGDIEVKPGPSNKVIVRADRDDDEIEVDMFQSGDRITIKVRYPSRNNYGNRGDVNFRIEYPATGKLLELHSISGNIEVKGISAELKLHSVSGGLEVAGCAGEMKLNAVSGDIELEEIGSARIDASTISGDVDYRDGSLEGGDFSFSSTSGNVTIAHDASASYQISGRTISGRISNNVGDSIEVKVAKYSGMQSVSGSFNGGGVWIEANTVSGDIILRKK